MHAGASDLSEAFDAGIVVVTAKDCASADTVSVASWDEVGVGICLVDPEDSHHLHVGLDLPRSEEGGTVTFGPDQFSAGCCNMNATCYIAVQGAVEEAKCGSWGCA